jgi:hypothetical protein
MELLTFSLILYQSKNCGHRIDVLFMMYDVYWYCQMKKKRMIMKFFKKEWFIWNGKPNKVKNKFYDMLIREGSATTCWYQKLFHSSEGILVRKLVTGHLPNWKLILFWYRNCLFSHVQNSLFTFSIFFPSLVFDTLHHCDRSIFLVI